jgi:hypothetical protein
MKLQEIINDFGCAVLNYTNNKIYVDYFYSENGYNNYLNGINCRQGQGLHNIDEKLEFNKINDNTLVIVQENGIEKSRYKYTPIFKATMEYKEITSGKNLNKTLTFSIRKSIFDGTFNLIEMEGNSLDFNSVQSAKNYLNDKYGKNKLIDWSVTYG